LDEYTVPFLLGKCPLFLGKCPLSLPKALKSGKRPSENVARFNTRHHLQFALIYPLVNGGRMDTYQDSGLFHAKSVSRHSFLQKRSAIGLTHLLKNDAKQEWEKLFLWILTAVGYDQGPDCMGIVKLRFTQCLRCSLEQVGYA
jgi:hypothetical protein